MTEPKLSGASIRRRLYLALFLNGSIIAGEFAAGYLVGSVGLMTDAWHNLIDQGALALSLYAHLLAGRPATASRTFGFHRAGIIVAFVNSLILLGAVLGLGVMAVHRLIHLVPVPGGWVGGISLLSCAANLAVAMILERGAEHDLNIRAAFWHMMGDAWVSFGVAASGAIIYFTHWYALDPVMSFVILLVILRGAWPILRDSIDVLLETTPTGTRVSHVVEVIQGFSGVKSVHDVHVWALKPGLNFLTCHVLVKDGQSATVLLREIRARVAAQCKIHHVTIQVETECDDDLLHCDLDQLVAPK